MNWRERIQAARERGKFSNRDRKDIGHGATCIVGEVALYYGVDYYVLAWAPAATQARGHAMILLLILLLLGAADVTPTREQLEAWDNLASGHEQVQPVASEQQAP